MSKYHPLDVRHPSNRNRERNNYLLEPPDANSYALRSVTATAQAPSRRSADYRSAVPAQQAPNGTSRTAAAVAAVTAAAPWGGTTASNTTTPGTTAQSPRRSFGLPKLLFFGVLAFLILRNSSLWDQLSRFVTRTAYDLGLF